MRAAARAGLRTARQRGFASLPSDAPAALPMHGGRILHASLVENGVEHVFGYSGGANLPILDAFHESPITFVMNRSEQCCGHAAEGYAKASGKVGVILTTSGPGAPRGPRGAGARFPASGARPRAHPARASPSARARAALAQA